MGRIVVGVDESEGAAEAVRWAVREGGLRSWGVTAVLAWGFLDQHKAVAGAAFDRTYDAGDAEEALAGLVAKAIGEASTDAINLEVVCDLPARALLEASSEADMLAVGARGLGGFTGLLLGSVSQHCLHHSEVPVAVVRPRPPEANSGQRIVVGSDGSEPATRAVMWAVEEARLRGAKLTPVVAWQTPYVVGYPYPALVDPGVFEQTAHQLASNAVEVARSVGLSTDVDPVVRGGGAAEVILAASEDADLIVLGSRGLGGFAGLLLGSTTLQVTHHARTTVIVVPTGGDRR